MQTQSIHIIKTTNYTSSSMKKVASLFLAPTVAMLSLISAHANQGTSYYKGHPAFDWETTDTAIWNTAARTGYGRTTYEHEFRCTSRTRDYVKIAAISCNNSGPMTPFSLRWLGDGAGAHYKDMTPGGRWHWSFHVEKSGRFD